MCTARLAIATTSLEGDSASENGFDGRLMVADVHSGLGDSDPGWMCTVESQAADMTSEWAWLYTTERTPLSCVLSTVCEPDATSILDETTTVSIGVRLQGKSRDQLPYLLTSQSRQAVNSSLSSLPKQMSRTGARCSYFASSTHVFPSATS